MSTILPALRSARLTLAPLAGEALDAWVRGDRTALRRRLGIVFPDVEGDPPMVGADLPELRASTGPDRLDAWWVWISAVRDVGIAVGTLALECRGESGGAIRIAHWTYPQWKGRAFAREAADTIASWVLHGPRAADPFSPSVRPRLRPGDAVHVGPKGHHRIGEVLLYGTTVGSGG